MWLSLAIALFHAAAMLSPRRTKACFFARLNSFSSFSLRGWMGKMSCVYAKHRCVIKVYCTKKSYNHRVQGDYNAKFLYSPLKNILIWYNSIYLNPPI